MPYFWAFSAENRFKMMARRETLYILFLVCVFFDFQKSQAQIFIGDNSIPGIFWAPLPDPRGNTSLLDGSFSLISLPAGSSIESLAYDPNRERIYWSDFYNSLIRSIQLDGTDLDNPMSTFDPLALALDLQRGKMYWTNYNSGTVGSANLDGSDSVIFGGSYDFPVSILVDPVSEYVLWSQRFPPESTKADLNGHNSQVVNQITMRGAANELCADGTSRVFYLDEGPPYKVGVINLDGSNDRLLTDFPQDNIETGGTLTRYGRKLLWVIRSPYRNFIYEYDMMSSTLASNGMSLMLSSGGSREYTPHSIWISSNVTYDEPVAIEGCPPNITINLDEGSSLTPVSWAEPNINAMSSCPSIEFSGNIINGANASAGVFDLSYMANDTAGNTDVCKFTVTVLEFFANECELGTDNCDANALCTNIAAGTFTCMCNEGFTGNGTTCKERVTTEQPSTTPSIQTMTSTDRDRSGSGATFFSFSAILRTFGFAFLFVITFK